MVRLQEATVSFASLEIQLAAAGRDIWAMDVVARLGGGESSDELFILSQNTPLILDDVRVRPPFAVAMMPQGDWPAARITRTEARNSDWSEAELVLRLRWCRPGAAEFQRRDWQETLETPCLVLPNMLPRLVSAAGAVSLRPPSRLPRIFFGDELPPELNAGGVTVPDRDGGGTPELLQTVIFPTFQDAPDFNDLVITESTAQSDPVVFEQVYDYTVRLLEYLSEQFGSGLPVRPVVCLTDSPSGYPSSGAYCPVPYSDVGARKKNSGKPAHVIRLLAQAWIAGGIRLWGENAADLALAIGGAYGLHRLHEQGHEQHLRQLIEISERSIAEAESSKEWMLADRVRAMEIAFFRGLSNPKLRSELRMFVRDNWGNFVMQDSLIAFLRKRGVAVPHVFA